MFRELPVLSRRRFLTAGVGLVAVACASEASDATPSTTTANDGTTDSSAPTTTTPTTTTESTTTEPGIALVDAPPWAGDTDPFTLGVASGDPDPESVVLWTRLLGGPDGDHSVALDIAEDGAFEQLVSSELVAAPAAYANTVHAIAGGLAADSWYWYRFRIGDHTSAIGRTRTTPETGVDTPLRLAFSSCQNWESGAYGAHRLLAARDHDLFVWLGDYIYEYGPGNGGVITSAGLRIHDTPEVTDLDGYRRRYALYRSDGHLQAHHAACPWVVTWDDHEIDNNHAGLATEDGQPGFPARRDAAHQAWWEHMPVRLDPPEPGAAFRIHRTIEWGTLVELHMLDGRQYRDPQPTDGEPIQLPGVPDFGIRTLGPTALDPAQSMLGPEQEAWLFDSLASSSARWNVLGNQVFMHGLNAFPGEAPATNPDTWDGYAGARKTLLETAAGSGVQNLVVLTGDFHSSSVGDIRPDPYDPTTPIVATELMAPAISSRFPAQLAELAPLVLGFNPQVRWFEPDNGFMSCTIEADRWVTEVHVLDDVTDEGTGARVAATVTILDGVPGANEIVEQP